MGMMTFVGGELKFKEVVPGNIADKILERQAPVVKRAIEQKGRELLNQKGYSENNTTGRSFEENEVSTSTKGNRYISIRPVGTRPNGRKTKRKAEVAFLNEYGVPGKRIAARKFMERALESVQKELDEIAQEEIDRIANQIF